MSDHVPSSLPQASRGPAPPLPEKPPSVAERTRLLRSSFRKDETEKPKLPEKPDNKNMANIASQKSDKSSAGSVYGERSPSPPQVISSHPASSPMSITPSPAGGLPAQRPPIPEKNVSILSLSDSNKEASERQSPAVGSTVCISHV